MTHGSTWMGRTPYENRLHTAEMGPDMRLRVCEVETEIKRNQVKAKDLETRTGGKMVLVTLKP